MFKKVSYAVLNGAKLAAIPFLCYELVTNNMYSVGFVDGSSMAPSLNPLYSRYRASQQLDAVFIDHMNVNSPKRGDVVIFKSPLDPNRMVIKRVVALPGEFVEHRLDEASYLSQDEQLVEGVQEKKKRTMVPQGHVWVEGDNPRTSKDSNNYGPIPIGLIRGTTKHIVFPFERAGYIPHDSSLYKNRVSCPLDQVDEPIVQHVNTTNLFLQGEQQKSL